MLPSVDLLPLCAMSATLVAKLWAVHGVITVQQCHPVLEYCCLASIMQAIYCGLPDFYVYYLQQAVLTIPCQ